MLYGAHLAVLEGQIQEFDTSTNITGNFHHSLPWLLQARVPSSLQVILGFHCFVCLFLIIIIVLYKDVIQVHGLNENSHFVQQRMEAEIFSYLQTVDV